MKVWLILACIVSVTTLLPERAEANFINGVETFAGNTFDTSTWQLRYNSVVTQNNGLTIPSGEVVTANSLVPVGAGARVQFSVSEIPGVTNNYPGAVQLFLTTNSAGAATGAWNDSLAAELSFELWAGNTHPGDIDTFIDHPGGGSGLVLGHVTDSTGAMGRTFTMEIDRPTSQQYAFSVFDSSTSSIGNVSLSATDFPGPLYIDLHTDGGTTATFSRVTLVPEPAAFSLLAAAGLGLLTRSTSRRFKRRSSK
jgi:hypothetical protein